jgi:HD-like signal output (HDOD) protein
MVNTQLVKRINSLPPLPQTVSELEKAYADPNVDVKKIAKIVEQDPMVVADLLKTLNSAYYGLRKEISSVEQAVALLGMKAVKDLVVSLSLRNMLRSDLSPYGLSSEQLAKISQFQSILAEKWMRKLDASRADRARLLALLQEIGKIVIADELLMEDEGATFKAELDAGWDIREIERNFVDATTAEVSAAMLRHWEFEPIFADIIHWADQPNQADMDVKLDAWVLRVANEAVSVRDPLSEKNRKRALLIAQKGGYSTDDLQTILDELAERWNA